MSYWTTLYAVDLKKLRSRVGSKDASLISAIKRRYPEEWGIKPPENPAKVARVKVAADGKIFLNQNRVSAKKLKASLAPVAKKRGTVYYYVEKLRVSENKRSDAAAWKAVLGVEGNPRIELCWNEKQLYQEEDDTDLHDEEITVGEALEELVEGQITRPTSPHQYGYALKLLCMHVGKYLNYGEMADLKTSGLRTPLTAYRSPIKLPRNRDFPYIGHLTTDEVKTEVRRLSQMDLSYAKDKDVESESRTYFKCLQEAARRNLAVVGFYH